eukprot:m.338264 g.338264  ORF g.338264 m.338264 type:complete len:91 (+) comp55731_c0_seq1:493-765(+)
MNHSATHFNVACDERGDVYALRDLESGEEMLEDYGTFEHPQWYYNLHDEFGVPHSYFDKQRATPAHIPTAPQDASPALLDQHAAALLSTQ